LINEKLEDALWITATEEHKLIIQEIAASSDRAAAIVACAVVEESLKDRLKASLRKKSSTVDSLLDPNGQLGSIAARNRLAYAMEIYDQDTFQNIDTISLIRNAFAHRTEDRDFNSDAARKLCGQLGMNAHARKVRKQMEDAGYVLAEIKPRKMFEMVVSETLMVIAYSAPGGPPGTLFFVSSMESGRIEWSEVPKSPA
jgi:DNA-binding MltR family transcriptional regulator